MKYLKKLNLTKKLSAFSFTFLMITTCFNSLPTQTAYSAGTHNIKISGAEKAEKDSLVYNLNGYAAGTIKIDEFEVSSVSEDGIYVFSDIPSGNHTITITCFNGYSLNNLKINGNSHSASDCTKITDNMYTYNLQLHEESQNINIQAEFKANVPSNSKSKLYVGETLCIDETTTPPITHYEGKGFSVSPGEKEETYVISLQPGASIESISAEGNIGAIIKTSGVGSISSKDGYSIKGIENLTLCDSKGSTDILELKGGIQASKLIDIRRNTRIGSQSSPSPKGISSSGRNAQNNLSVSTEYAKLEIYTSDEGLAFENISGDILAGSKGNIHVISEGKILENSEKIIVRDGGSFEASSKNPEFSAKAYSHWMSTQDKIYDFSDSLAYSKQEVKWDNLTKEQQESFSYDASASSEPNSEGYYTWNLKSLSLPMNKFVYGKNISGEVTSLIQGDIKVISGSGVKLSENSKVGEYKLQSDCEIRISLMPKYGYQLNKNAISSLSMIPQENKGEYIFKMPNKNIFLEDLFAKSSDQINVNSSHIKSARLNIKDGLIYGNAELTIKPILAPENSSEFEKNAGKFNILGYFDISLDEVIFKNGDVKNGCWRTSITELSEPMEISLDLSEALRGKKSYCILREHNGKISNLGGTYDSKGSELKFSTDQYSSYAVGSSDNVRSLSTSAMFNGEEIKLIIEDPNDALSDTAKVEMTLAEENSERYNELKNNLDDTYKPNNLVFFDIVIYKDDTKKEKYSQLDKKVNAFLQIPKGWSKEELQAVLVSEGLDTDFDEEIVSKDGVDYVSFWTDHFSPYAFLDELKDLNWDDNNSTQTPDDDNTTPVGKEGDNNDLANFITGDKYRTIIIVAAAAVIISLVVLIVMRKKKK